jgi:hypothetical protein
LKSLIIQKQVPESTSVASGEASVSSQPPRDATINVKDTSAEDGIEPATDGGPHHRKGDHHIDLKGLGRDTSAGSTWNSLKPGGPTFTDALTPSATTPGETTPGVFSFDEPFDKLAPDAVDPDELSAKMDELHDGGLEGGFHAGDDHGHDD